MPRVASRRSFRLIAPALALAAVLGANAAPASAGEYEIRACGPAPGGVNHLFAQEVTAWNPPPDARAFQFSSTCPGAGTTLEVRSRVGAYEDGSNPNATFLNAASWVFKAPPGTSITRLRIWRSGGKLRTASGDPDPDMDGDQGDTWDVNGRDGAGNIIGGQLGGETCRTAHGDIGCSFGSDEGYGSARAEKTYELRTNEVRYGIGCVSLSGCPRWYADVPVTWMRIFGAVITLSEDVAPTGLTAGGGLFAEGWRRGDEPVTYSADDAHSGIAGATLTAGGRRVGADAPGCDFTRPVPCPTAARGRSLTPEERLPEGVSEVELAVRDAAGNVVRLRRVVGVDTVAPGIAFGPSPNAAADRALAVGLSDQHAGAARAKVEIRALPDGAWRAVDGATLGADGTRLDATLPADADALRTSVRVTVTDHAGNVATQVADPVVVDAGRPVRRVRHGRPVVLRGRLVRGDGAPLAGRTLTLLETIRRAGAARREVATVTTDAAGAWTHTAPAGPSRTLEFASPAAGDLRADTASVALRVPARFSLRITPRRLRAGRRTRISGRILSLGQPLGATGRTVLVQAFDRRRWRTFESPRARSDGRFSVSYRFGNRPGRYPMRVCVRRDALLPFESACSRTVVVRTRR